MSGYRQSSYDPMASPRYGRPLRPYNWVQWTGVGLIVVGLAIDVLYFTSRLGWIAKADAPLLALPPIMIGALLVNSRREQVADPAPELAAARKRWLIIVTILCVAMLGAAVILDYLGV
jgi:hypothetical protein